MLNPNTKRKLAADLFNATWELLNTDPRTPLQDEEMVHAAHASAYFWIQVGNAQNQMRSHWQIARVYAAVGRAGPAIHHAEQAMALCADRVLTTFDHACAFEVHARAMACAERFMEARISLQRAKLVAAALTDPDERRVMDDDIGATEATLPRSA